MLRCLWIVILASVTFAMLLCKNFFKLSVFWVIEKQFRNESWLPFVIDGELVTPARKPRKFENRILTDCVFTVTLLFNNWGGFAYGQHHQQPSSFVSEYSTDNWRFQSTVILLYVYYLLHWLVFALTQAECQTLSECG